jgi:hypothetical protein
VVKINNMIITSKDFDKQPLWFSALNRTWRGTYFLGTKIRLDKDDLIRSARKLTGLTDLGKEFSDEPLERLIRSANEEARLHPVGRFITRERLKSLLAIRLRAEYYFSHLPEILEQPLYPAWVIIGLQRTGTTKLQRLLASDPDHRVLPSWEVINPVPLQVPPPSPPTSRGGDIPQIEAVPLVGGYWGETSPGSKPYHLSGGIGGDKGGVPPGPDPRRIRLARTSVKALKLMSPGFFAIHPIDAMQPEEDILLLDVSFMSTTAEAMMHVPSYSEWLERTDQSPAYEYYVKMLKLLQWFRPAKRWVLKTPHHLEFLGLIEKHFNEVRFLWPHRTIYESVPSFLSMVSFNRMVFSNDVDPHEVGLHWVRKTGYMLEKALGFRSQPGKEHLFMDLQYKNLVSHPLHELERLYSAAGGITPELAEKFRATEDANPHRKYGTHVYSLSDFGLNKNDIDKHTLHYQEFTKTLHGKEEKPV